MSRLGMHHFTIELLLNDEDIKLMEKFIALLHSTGTGKDWTPEQVLSVWGLNYRTAYLEYQKQAAEGRPR